MTVELDGDFRAEWDRLHEGDVEIKITKYRQRRSLDANAYAWVLIDKIAQRMRLPKEEVYREHILSIGGVSETVCVTNEAVDKLCEVWQKNGLGWQTVRFPSKLAGCTNVTLYYGSSEYDTAQMAALIDQIVQSCRSLGIETMDEAELKSLVEDYKKC